MTMTAPIRPPRTSAGSPSFAFRGLIAGLALALGLTACSTADGPGGPTAPTTPAGAFDAPAEGPLPDPTAGLTAIGWIEQSGSFAELPLGSTDIDAWPDLLTAIPGPSGADRIIVTTTVERDPDACTLWRVLVTDVAFGDGIGAEGMRAAVLAELTSIDHDPGPLLGPGEEPWCGDREPAERAWYASVLTSAFCALPDGDPVQCLTITTMRYDGGAHPNVVHADLVFDAATGIVFDATAILATRDLEISETTAFVESTVCDLDIAAGLASESDGCWPITLRNTRPTSTGLIFSFAPYESGPYALGPRDLFIPWDDLEVGASVPAAAWAMHRDLRIAFTSGDWMLVDALLPSDGRFLVATGRESDDPVTVLRDLPRDPRTEVLAALGWLPGRLAGTTVWPELAVRDPFVIDSAERAALDAAFGADAVRTWETAGRYLGWRAGIDDGGTWRFIVAGD
jgi:hypothetical protein